MIVDDIGLEETTYETGAQMDSYTKVGYYIKIKANGKWYVNREKHYPLEEALKIRDEELNGVKGSRC